MTLVRLQVSTNRYIVVREKLIKTALHSYLLVFKSYQIEMNFFRHLAIPLTFLDETRAKNKEREKKDKLFQTRLHQIFFPDILQ